MNTITQTMRFRQALIQYSLKYGVTKAAIRYKVNRQYVYRWQKRDITILLKHSEIAYPLSVYNNRYQEKVFRMTIPFASHFSNLLNKRSYIEQTIDLKSICETHCLNM